MHQTIMQVREAGETKQAARRARVGGGAAATGQQKLRQSSAARQLGWCSGAHTRKGVSTRGAGGAGRRPPSVTLRASSAGNAASPLGGSLLSGESAYWTSVSYEYVCRAPLAAPATTPSAISLASLQRSHEFNKHLSFKLVDKIAIDRNLSRSHFTKAQKCIDTCTLFFKRMQADNVKAHSNAYISYDRLV